MSAAISGTPDVQVERSPFLNPEATRAAVELLLPKNEWQDPHSTVAVSRFDPATSRDGAYLGLADESRFRRVAACSQIRSAPNRRSIKTRIRHAIANA
jgi:hypothetical protein